jgi:hypothetical protein
MATTGDFDVIVVGAGIAGLSCASELKALGVERTLVLEASHHLGGRIHTIRESELAAGWPSGHARWLRRHEPRGRATQPLGAHNYGFEVGAEFIHGPDTVLGKFLRKHVRTQHNGAALARDTCGRSGRRARLLLSPCASLIENCRCVACAVGVRLWLAAMSPCARSVAQRP